MSDKKPRATDRAVPPPTPGNDVRLTTIHSAQLDTRCVLNLREQICFRLRNLKQAFNQLSREAARSGKDPSEWVFYDKMKSIWFPGEVFQHCQVGRGLKPTWNKLFVIVYYMKKWSHTVVRHWYPVDDKRCDDRICLWKRLSARRRWENKSKKKNKTKKAFSWGEVRFVLVETTCSGGKMLKLNCFFQQACTFRYLSVHYRGICWT